MWADTIAKDMESIQVELMSSRIVLNHQTDTKLLSVIWYLKQKLKIFALRQG